MKKTLMVVGLALAAMCAGYGQANAAQTCTTSCDGASALSCTVASGSCTSAPNQVTCCGQTHTCSAFDSWYVCFFICVHGFPPSGAQATKGPEASPLIQQNCNQKCGSVPPLTFSC
jgi:hypothetical protein